VNEFPTIKTWDHQELPVLTRQQAKFCASVIHSVTWKQRKLYPYGLTDWKEEYTVYPPNFNLGMESGPSFNSDKEARDYIKKQGWRALPPTYIRYE